MSARVFVDSNCILYLYELESTDERARAREWFGALTDFRAATTNLQVLNEVTNVFFKRMKQWSPDEIFDVVDTFSTWGRTSLSDRDVALARQLRIRHRYSWWDCLLLASAVNLGCSHFLSEDLQDGQVIAGLTIVDPFAHTPEQILLSR